MKNLFTTRLQELIRESGKKQNQISSELNITKQKLSNWKLGYIEPCFDELLSIALYFDVTTDFLLGLEDEFGTKRKQE
ncbi:MAG: helix-turn-helix transcriptional regulator [Clostridia bacterium]|nr:helix-turn-helix transcriptional regulator [Clostridia bacterium]